MEGLDAIIEQLAIRAGDGIGVHGQIAGHFADRGDHIARPHGAGGDGEHDLANDLFVDGQAVSGVDSIKHWSVQRSSDVVQYTRLRRLCQAFGEKLWGNCKILLWPRYAARRISCFNSRSPMGQTTKCRFESRVILEPIRKPVSGKRYPSLNQVLGRVLRIGWMNRALGQC